MEQTAVEWLVEQMKKYNMTVSVHNTSHQNVMDFYKAIEQAKEMEREQKNDLPVHFHEGVSNIWVFIEDGIIHVMPSPETFKSE
jgi:sulfatase maturation enzyme AslB (radical SAM superfamily)